MMFSPQWHLMLVVVMFIPAVVNAKSLDQGCYPKFPVRYGILCYPRCKSGYANYGQGLVCLAKCPKETTNTGLSCRKHSYGRGAGVPLTSCPKGMEKNGGLCYPWCKSGYHGVGPVCWRYCKSGETDRGTYCRTPSRSYRRNTRSCPWYDKCGLCGGPWYNKCGKRRNCGAKCKGGYLNYGCICRRPSVNYAKHSYGRGAGKPLRCASGQEQYGALCYPKCRPGYYGLGPVCRAICSGETYEKGGYCHKKKYVRLIGKPLTCFKGIFSKASLKKVDTSNITNLWKNLNIKRMPMSAVCLSLWSVSKPLVMILKLFSTCTYRKSWNTIVLSISGQLQSISTEIGLAIDVKSNKAACYFQHCIGFGKDVSNDVAVNFGWFRSLGDIPGKSKILFGSFNVFPAKLKVSFARVTNSAGSFVGVLSSTGFGSSSPLPSVGVGICNTPKNQMISFTP